MNAPHTHSSLATDWSTQAIVDRRNRFYSASQRKFVPYKDPLIIKRGRGQYVWDEQDRKYIDLLGMNLCISVGHAHPQVVKAAREQVAELTHCTTMFYHPVPAQYAEELAGTMPAGHDWVVHFTNSGAEAIDLALLMARSHTGNIDMLALASSYHGATFGAQSVTGIAGFRHCVPQLGGVVFVAEPNQYRGVHGESVEPYLKEIDRAIATSTSGKLAGMIIEPVQGYGGIVPIPEGYIASAFERVRAAGGVCIIDEVQAGVGRTGHAFWSFESHGVVPDIVVVAKGVGNGIPLGAVIAKRQVAESMADKFLFHTYGANPVACAAGRAVLKVIQEERLQENARDVGAALKVRLEDMKQRFPIIGDVRGRGLMLAIELVRDRTTKEPAPEETLAVFEETRRNGLVASRSGPYRNVIRMCPPLCLAMADVDDVADRFERSFAAVSGRNV
ncbi:aspartate aminotransferase family protein [Mesorhizobium sp. WSM4935]|uniref:aspartate aminotransferase family protein n=1 Tax=Mesorhizobium sp. WSM4935 TaxID=3038547 RepID=UPI00241571F0|nr:aspartate aminotransferase family protein [Mesorhizobium sp. WSM4935]MDG4877220.1 aspartate aminotransferase family protein [Mesorhizobium sp. WSM4935]